MCKLVFFLTSNASTDKCCLPFTNFFLNKYCINFNCHKSVYHSYSFQLAILGTVASKIDGGWDTEPNTQYHIQTDEGPERYFKYQTISGQYRKERRLQDGSVVGTYGWVDADGYLRLNDYVADSKGKFIYKYNS